MPDTNLKDEKKEKGAVKKDNGSKKRLEGLKRYFGETKAEFRKIVWPTPKQTMSQTLIVLFSILVIGVFIWGLDSLSSLGLSKILNNY